MRNKLNGEIPPALFNSSSLSIINLAYNDFSGSIPSFSKISSPLQYLSLTGNNLSGGIPTSLGNVSSLVSLLLAQNNLQGSIPESLSRIVDLQELDLTYNNLSGIVPPSLYTITSLTYLGLGANQLVGKIPSNIGYTLPNIQELIMEGNKFDGPIPTSLANTSNLQNLDLRGNAFNGVVPSLGSLQNLVELDLGANKLEAGDWTFLSSLTRCIQLQRLLLDTNSLHGILPRTVANLSKNIEWLLLNENQITGTTPSELGNLTSLTLLHIEQNLLAGNIPDTLGNLRNLFVLNLSQNKLSGVIPQSIGNLEQLSELYFQENNLRGSIPASLAGCKNLVMLNLSCNSFHGTIPRELFSVSSLAEGLDLSYNQLTGPIPSEIGSLINLSPLNISNNQLSGEIPSTLSECLHLEYLHMEGNFLQGRIPRSFMSLRGIIEMDLSRNNLSGEIPNIFDSFSSLQLLNLSFNNFEGPIPTGGLFASSSGVFIQGNNRLCASSPMKQLPLCMSSPSKRKKTSYLVATVVPLTIVILVTLACVAAILMKRREAKQPTDQLCKQLKKFSYDHLVKATNDFSSDNLIGSGRFGSVYRGVFEFEAQIAAIKVFKLDQIGAPKNFLVECEALRNTRHRNLVRVISVCSTFDPTGNEFKAIILEYMANGNLESWLHPKQSKQSMERPLSFGSRIMIAVDIAAALDYLHHQCTPPWGHCDLKPSNILLDDEMTAHVSALGPRGSIGYIAPEYGLSYKISSEGDVYSYGVILLEMLTGKSPTDEMFKDGMNLYKLVESAFPQKICEILEPNLIQHYEDEEANHNLDHENDIMARMQSCARQLAKLGLKCCMHSPKDRPEMRDVYAEIITIKETLLALQN